MSVRRSCQAGLSLLEFTLVVILFSVLVALAFERIAALRTSVERARVESTVAAMRSSLSLEFARRLVSEERRSLAGLAGVNALELLAPRPSGYVATAHYSPWREAPPETWFFDRERRAVVYRASGPAIVPGSNGDAVAAWRARLRGRDHDGDGRVDPASEPVSGVWLERIE